MPASSGGDACEVHAFYEDPHTHCPWIDRVETTEGVLFPVALQPRYAARLVENSEPLPATKLPTTQLNSLMKPLNVADSVSSGIGDVAGYLREWPPWP